MVKIYGVVSQCHTLAHTHSTYLAYSRHHHNKLNHMLAHLAKSSRKCIHKSVAARFATGPADVVSESTKAPESSSKSKLLHSFKDLSDEVVAEHVRDGTVSQYKLERELKKAVLAGQEPDCRRAVRVRRLWLESELNLPDSHITDDDRRQRGIGPLSTAEAESSRGLPYADFDFNNFYRQVLGTNCENVIGYIPIPVGFVGPLSISGKEHYVPLATTEGALVASTNRGCRAITESGGATSTVFRDGMTRAPVFCLPSAERAANIATWVAQEDNLSKLQAAFSSTTRFGKLKSIKASVAGRNLFLRFNCQTGDAMGMNMISKGVMECVGVMEQEFPEMVMLAVSGNVCTDKKPSAMNWIEGRGKSVVAEATLSGQVIVDVLKCTVQSLVDLNVAKNLVGSSMAGSIGGNNAHAANMVTAVFLATGQDPAQNVESSNCMTLMEAVNDGQDLHVSVTMPSIEVGTVGGGTGLSAQRACLEMMGLAGASSGEPGDNARDLARVTAGVVLAGEISLMSALASNHLVSAHMKLNR